MNPSVNLLILSKNAPDENPTNSTRLMPQKRRSTRLEKPSNV
jgi:hypothetical protein